VLTAWWVVQEADVVGDQLDVHAFIRAAGTALAERSAKHAVYESSPGRVGFSAVFEANGRTDAADHAALCYEEISAAASARVGSVAVAMSALPRRVLELSRRH
jgi:hypothetical protein